MENTYSPPVSALLTYGEIHSWNQEWPDYVTELGLKQEHIPELVRVISDDALINADEETAEVWAVLHAWRALGQLRAAEATGPLLKLLNGDDMWAWKEIPRVVEMIGKDAIPALRSYISDSSYGGFERGRAVECMQAIVDANSETCEEAIAFLTSQLNNYMNNSSDLNGYIIEALCRLDAKDAANMMEMVYRMAKVDSRVVHWDRIMAFKNSHAAQ